MRSAMYFEPIRGQAFQSRNFVADFIVKNFSPAAGDRVKAGVAQARNRIAQTQVAVFGNRENLRRRVAVQVRKRRWFTAKTDELR